MTDFFQQYGRLLWSVLAGLARGGYVTSPDEGRELMRSFFVEAWPKVLRDFDKRKAGLQTYLAHRTSFRPARSCRRQTGVKRCSPT